MREHFRTAIENVTKYGDTDVFPFPVENHVFYDKQEQTLQLLERMHREFDDLVLTFPPFHETTLAAAGYAGFRVATQIDPIWNAYLLALVVSVGADIEAKRLPVDQQAVFSYRFSPDRAEKTLFAPNLGWIEFQQASVGFAREFSHVLACDISDFYPRVYHHRLENALKKATDAAEAISRIMRLLKSLSKGTSYGLPVGGPAARLLSELLLNRVDRLLVTHHIKFCRFADDYRIFAHSKAEAYDHLVFLSEKLLENEGLLLQKTKTRIKTTAEYLATSEFAEENRPESDDEATRRSFLSLRLRYDPYSPTADEDYEKLRQELQRFDVVGMLATEMQKTHIHEPLARRLIASVRYIPPEPRNNAILSLMQSLHVLYPVFPTVMILLKAVIGELCETTQQAVYETLRDLLREGSYIVRAPVNLAYAIRALGDDRSDEADEVLTRIYDSTSSSIVRRDVILIMAKRNADYWLSDRLKAFHAVTPWEKRALVIASYGLEDEGKHWRDRVKGQLSPADELVRQWAAERKCAGRWSIPI